MTYEQNQTEEDERKYHVFTDGSFIEKRNAMGAAWMVVASDSSRQSEGVTRIDLSRLEEKGSSLIAEVIACSLALKQLAEMIKTDAHHPQVIIHSDCTDLLNEINKDMCQSAKKRFDAPALRTAFQELANDLDEFFHVKTKITHDESLEMRHVHDMATFATRSTSGKKKFIYNVDISSTIIDSSGPMHA